MGRPGIKIAWHGWSTDGSPSPRPGCRPERRLHPCAAGGRWASLPGASSWRSIEGGRSAKPSGAGPTKGGCGGSKSAEKSKAPASRRRPEMRRRGPGRSGRSFGAGWHPCRRRSRPRLAGACRRAARAKDGRARPPRVAIGARWQRAGEGCMKREPGRGHRGAGGWTPGRRGGGSAAGYTLIVLVRGLYLQQETKQFGAVEARRAHNPEVVRSKRTIATLFFALFPR